MTFKRLFACLLLSLFSTALFAQTSPSAEGARSTVWVGAEMSSFNPDWSCPVPAWPFTCWDHQLLGVATFSDVNNLVGRVGLEGEGRWLPWHGQSGLSQSTYLVGPRYQLLAGRRLAFNAKFLAGGAVFRPNSHAQWQGWAVFAPGGTLGYRMSRHVILRADYEYQMWPGFVGSKGPRGLTPNGFSVGASYGLFR